MTEERMKELNDEYAYLQWHKLWLKEEIAKANKRQDEIKKELTIGDETKIVKAPIMFKINSNVYHKVVALTDIDFVIDRSGE